MTSKIRATQQCRLDHGITDNQDNYLFYLSKNDKNFCFYHYKK
ncbi:hypothetical protein [Rickettsia endosymbiont of Polydrusus tereticollis]